MRFLSEERINRPWVQLDPSNLQKLSHCQIELLETHQRFMKEMIFILSIINEELLVHKTFSKVQIKAF